MARMDEATEIILQAGHTDAWAEVTELRNRNANLKTQLAATLTGLIEIAGVVMPDSYYATDSRVVAARKLIADLEKS